MRRAETEHDELGGLTVRRAWLIGAARWTAAALAVGGAAMLSLGRRGETTACPRPACARCGVRASCRLPAARNYREEAARSEQRNAATEKATPFKTT